MAATKEDTTYFEYKLEKSLEGRLLHIVDASVEMFDHELGRVAEIVITDYEEKFNDDATVEHIGKKQNK